MGAGEIVALDEHLATCQPCRDLVDVVIGPRRLHLLDALASDRFDRHLMYDRLAAACDGATLTAEESNHLDGCTDCGELLAELSTVRDEIKARADPDRVLPFARPQHGARWIPRALAASLLLFVSALAIWFANRQRSVDLNSVSHPVASQRNGTMTVTKTATEQLRDGDLVVTFDREGHVSGLRDASASTTETLQQLLKGSLQIRSIASLQSPAGLMLGAPGQPQGAVLLSPMGIVVRSRRPTFQWQRGEEAGLPVSIGVYDHEFNLVAGSAKVLRSKWECSTSLRRGEVYRWQITLRHGGRELIVPSPPSPEARFQVLSEPALAEIERVERSHANSHLMVGAAYVNAGLLDDAEREFRAFADANPSSSQAGQLLASLREARDRQIPLPITTKAAQ